MDPRIHEHRFSSLLHRLSGGTFGLRSWEVAYRLAKSSEPWERRIGATEDIAAMVAFLFSDDTDYIDGQTILVYGGANLT
jgi:NAD(P)-dependent dehydrogenase (short-subunit alcohol dehydrogenase family)